MSIDVHEMRGREKVYGSYGGSKSRCTIGDAVGHLMMDIGEGYCRENSRESRSNAKVRQVECVR